jgi:hypothetical protein
MFNAAFNAVVRDLANTLHTALPDDIMITALHVIANGITDDSDIAREQVAKCFEGREDAIARRDPIAFEGFNLMGTDMAKVYARLDEATQATVFDKLAALGTMLRVSTLVPKEAVADIDNVANALVENLMTNPDIMQQAMDAIMGMLPSLLQNAPELANIFALQSSDDQA